MVDGIGMLRAPARTRSPRSRVMPHIARRGEDSIDGSSARTPSSRPQLVVRLAVAAVRDRRRPFHPRDVDELAARSAAGRARSPADSDPRRARRPAAPAGCSRARTRRGRRARARASRRPPARARARRVNSRPCPRSSVTAMTSALVFLGEPRESPPTCRARPNTRGRFVPCPSGYPFTHCLQLPRERLRVRSPRQMTRIVSSPPIVPTTSGSPARSIASASGCACADSVRSTTSCWTTSNRCSEPATAA